ncbi:hypothetical protein DNL40_15880 [Xylanimonas oleitrophica]|uniref:Lipoprotein LpqN n=1 Tax=Xylanimonas oleitrophica TaxID=2607479 RepID=A0A2W5YBY4_9MICO|nr:hypothetical protein [Xylanimonas oleitrophica]PZR51571.1 hypothetical protein DNL40_15880 [Xylanimonas oleitrophica]
MSPVTEKAAAEHDTEHDTERDAEQEAEPCVVEHPGPLLPGPPRFALEVPAGWTAAPAPRALAVVTPSDPGAPSAERFVPNLTVTADLVPAGTSAGQVLDAMLAAYPGTSTRAVAEHEDRAGARLARPHEAVTVHQHVDVHVDATRAPAGHRHAVTVVSSWSSTTPTSEREALAHAHSSFRLGTAAPVEA